MVVPIYLYPRFASYCEYCISSNLLQLQRYFIKCQNLCQFLTGGRYPKGLPGWRHTLSTHQKTKRVHIGGDVKESELRKSRLSSKNIYHLLDKVMRRG